MKTVKNQLNEQLKNTSGERGLPPTGKWFLYPFDETKPETTDIDPLVTGTIRLLLPTWDEKNWRSVYWCMFNTLKNPDVIKGMSVLDIRMFFSINRVGLTTSPGIVDTATVTTSVFVPAISRGPDPLAALVGNEAISAKKIIAKLKEQNRPMIGEDLIKEALGKDKTSAHGALLKRMDQLQIIRSKMEYAGHKGYGLPEWDAKVTD